MIAERPTRRWLSLAWAYLELVRLPNLFTAMGDVVMGFLFTHAVFEPGDGWKLGMLVAGSSALYAAGVVLGDVFDLEVDRRWRPERPLPSGRVSLAAAKRLGWGLLLLGVAVAWVVTALGGDVRPGIVASLLAGCVAAYDGFLKRTPAGPPAMGACRMLNVLLGMSLSQGVWRDEHWLAAGAIGTYIAGVTWFARTEARRSNRLPLALATAVILAGIGLLGLLPRMAGPDRVVSLLQQQPQRWTILMLFLGAVIGFRCLRAVVEPLPSRVQMVVRQCILSLVLLDAAACFVVRGLFGAVVVLVLLVPVLVFGQWFRST